MTEKQKKLTKVESNTVAMIRIGSWFGRRQSSLWSVYEEESLKLIEPINQDDFAFMETYYTAHISRDGDIRRRDVPALLNNWISELDRAHKFKVTRKPAEAVALVEPEGWVKAMTKHLSHSDFETNWNLVLPDIKREIISVTTGVW